MTISQFPPNQANCNCKTDTTKAITLKLPVAPRAYARIRFAPTDDSARAATPDGALTWIAENLEQGVNIEAFNITGPGDPLAEIESTTETLRLIKQKYPEIPVHLTTLGVHGNKYAQKLSDNGVTHVTILVDAVDADIAKKLYAWIRPDCKTVPLTQAVDLLLTEQKQAITAFKDVGCKTTIYTTVYLGCNDMHINQIARTAADIGVDTMILAPCSPCADFQEGIAIAPDLETMNRLKKQAAQHITVSVEQKRMNDDNHKQLSINALMPKFSKDRPNVAVASHTGMEVDLHLGQASHFLIYGPREDGLNCLLESRPAPATGGGKERWQNLAQNFQDCFVLLASGAGTKPKKILGDHGITVLVTDDDIEGMVDVLYGSGSKKSCKNLQGRT